MQIIWDLVKEKLTTEETKNELLLGTDREGRTAWHEATYWGKLDIMQQIWKCAKGKLTTGEINNKFLIATDHKERTIWHVAANCNNIFFREFM